MHESVKDAFVEALAERTKALRVGDPLDEETDMGPMCTPEVVTRTQEHLQDATDKGATIVLGGGHEGQFHEPTIVDGASSRRSIRTAIPFPRQKDRFPKRRARSSPPGRSRRRRALSILKMNRRWPSHS